MFITARVHPGETNSSYVCEGLINFFLSNSLYAENLRNFFILKIIPMLNPDGVIHGHYRTSLHGDDLNRRWDHPEKNQHPEIYALKKMMVETEYKKALYLDLHGHSKKKSSFIYGCYNPENPYLCK